MQLAAEDLIRDWVQISEPALNKFMNDNFSKAWDKYDTYNRGQIAISEGSWLIRSLLEVNAPEPQHFQNPYEVSDKDYDEIRAELDKKKSD